MKIMIKKITMFVALSLMVVGCSTTQKTYYSETTDSYKLARMVKGQNVIRPKLADPDNARFRNVYLNSYGVDGKWVHMTCGEVRSSNPDAMYENFERFISTGETATSLLESEYLTQDDFMKEWREKCM